MSGRLKDRIAIVTGAGQGIGAAIARRFVEEGARVMIAELNAETAVATARALRDDGYPALAVETDVASRPSVQHMVVETVKELGYPDVLVNNAGVAVFDEPLQLSEKDWRRCLAVDLDGVWYVCQAVLPHMIARRRGSIVNIAWVHSVQSIPGCFPYPVAKHAVIGLTRALAIEYAPRNVRVNAVCPAYVATPINYQFWNKLPDPDAEVRRIARLHPLQRIGDPDDVAWPVVFLACDESAFITGASLMVDGGISLLVHGHGEWREGGLYGGTE